ncbi:uncharacterized protein [Triticum aestivum]|uniref:uncharacterized protein isoform X2 n=1 Tax=Triticum aestivum TaxID=4565 RepID=UPI001D002D14|nr:uncharacterized protein LOC123104049 isoform X2 [Triticum aestivum]
MLRSGEGFGGEKLQIGGGVQKRNGSTDRLQCPSVAHIHSRVVGPTGCKPRPSQKPAQIVDSADRKADNEVNVFASRVCPSLISNSPKKESLLSPTVRSGTRRPSRSSPPRPGRIEDVRAAGERRHGFVSGGGGWTRTSTSTCWAPDAPRLPLRRRQGRQERVAAISFHLFTQITQGLQQAASMTACVVEDGNEPEPEPD